MFGRKKQGSVISTLVGEDTRIKGDVRFEGGCHIDGIVSGNVLAERDPEAFLSLSEQGRIEGSVRVPRVSLNGRVQGDVYATELLELGATAKIDGNLHYELLEMTAGAEINGKLIHDGAKPSAPNVARPATVQSDPGAEPAK